MEYRLHANMALCHGLGTLNTYNSSDLDRFLVRLYEPILDSPAFDIYNKVDDDLRSRLFTGLLNTDALAYAAPLAAVGDFELYNYTGDGGGLSVNITADTQSEDCFLTYDPVWLAVLMASSLAMLAAGVATMVLNLKRRGPGVLDSFTSLLKDNPYVSEETGPSTEDSSEKVRRLRKTRVMLGDIRPLEVTGYIVVTTRTDGDSVQLLRSGRLYY
jgi:hypothetical protein